MSLRVDGSVYPDEAPPQNFLTLAQKADYVHRLMAAFDYGLPPDAATLRLLRNWRDVFDAFPLQSSPGYHALRALYRWPEISRAPFPHPPAYLQQDAREGRSDGCEHRV